MKKFYSKLFLVFAVILLTSVNTWAEKPLKGSWTFTIKTGQDTTTLQLAFKSKGKGIITTSSGSKIPFVYRETSSSFSLSFEAPTDPVLGNTAMYIRGKKSGDNNVTGGTLVFAEQQDASNPSTYSSFATDDSVTGVRK